MTSSHQNGGPDLSAVLCKEVRNKPRLNAGQREYKESIMGDGV